MSEFCYFDSNATTRVASEVLEAMLPFLTERWGNPSSAYTFGNQVAKQIEAARAKAAALLNWAPKVPLAVGLAHTIAWQRSLATNPV